MFDKVGAVVLAEKIRPVTLSQERVFPVRAALRCLLPGGSLKRGSIVSVTGSGGAMSLALALLSEASRAGAWVTAVGLPDLGVVAAAEAGVVLDRLALVPRPGTEWPAVMAALLDGVELVLTDPPARMRAGDARRLASRARERGSVIVAVGTPWAEAADVRLSVSPVTRTGLGDGHGHLQARQVEVATNGRGAAARERELRLWLPAEDGTVAKAEPAASAVVSEGTPDITRHLQRVSA